MFRRILGAGGLAAVISAIPSLARAAAAKAEDLIVVADTRVITGVQLYFADLYNENMWMFAVWSVVLTTALGMALGILMDVLMKMTGIDLTKRSIVEH